MPEQYDANASRDASKDETISPLIKAFVDEQIQKAQETQERSRKKKWKNSWRSASPITKGTFLLAVAVAVATLAYSFIAGFQLREMKRTNILTKRALDDAEDARDREIRARLPEMQNYRLVVSRPKIPNGTYIATQTWRNIGPTRAINLDLEWAISSKPFDKELTVAIKRGVLIENDPVGKSSTVAIPMEEAASASKDHPIFLYGRESYDDIFGDENSHHHGEFCWRLWDFGVASPGLIGHETDQCETHNCTDESCKVK